jgi:hypothetical protein
MKGRTEAVSTALSGRRVKSVSEQRRRRERVARQLGAALAAGALSLFSGGIAGHALSLSTTTLTSGTNPSVWGQPVVFTATVTPVTPAPTGTVTFENGGTNIAGCVNRAVAARIATCSTAALAVGSDSITAVYGGNGTYATSTSSPVTQVVTLGTTTTVLASSVNPSVSGQTVTYTATVSLVAPASGTRTGTVAFQDGGAVIAGCGAKPVAAAGTATCALAYAGPGAHTITATYSGDGDFTTSTAAPLTQTVNTGATAVTVTSSANPSSTGANVTFTANVTAVAPASGTRTGAVDFQIGGVDITGCSAQVVPASGKATCVTNTMTVGANTITAIYSGDVNFVASTSASFAQTVDQGATTSKVVSSLNPSSTGVAVTFTATVTATAPASGTRTGTVAFEDGGVPLIGCAAQVLGAAGTATCATNALAAGVHTITAVYRGDGNFTTSTSPPLTQTVVSTTTTTVTSTANPSVFGQSIQYTAAVAGGPTVSGTITFRDGGSNIAGCVAVVMTAGSASCTISPTVASHKITAVYSGDASNAASTSAVMTQVVTADSTTTTLTASVNPTMVGQPVTFTATVTAKAPGSGAPTGKVAFDNGAAAIAGCGTVALTAGAATCTTSALILGVHSITAVYNGSSNDATSTSALLTETVNHGATTTAVGSSLNPSVSGQSVTYTATVTVVAPATGTPTGTVDFEDGGVTIAGCGAKALASAGTATCSFMYSGAGTHSIVALYSGDSQFTGSTSPGLTQNVNQALTSTAVASSVNPSVAGQSVTITATVSVTAPGSGTPTGTVMFEDGGVTITGCAAQAVSAAGTAVCATSFDTATHTIAGVYSGDANFSGSTSPILTQSVNQGATATLISSSGDPSVSGQAVSYTASVTALAPASGTPAGTATFMDGAITVSGCVAQPLIGGVAACTVAYPGAGSHTITAVYSGDPNFTGSTSPGLTQTVNPAVTSTSLASSVNPSVTGQPVTITATVSVNAPGSGAPTGIVAFLDDGTTIAGCAAEAVSGAGIATCADVFAAAGTANITAAYSGDVDFIASTSAPLTQTINQGATATVVISSVDPSVSGQPVSFSASVDAVAPAAGAPTGTVAFIDGAGAISGCGAQPLVAGMASCSVAYAGAGGHAITAVYSGDPNFTGSTSAILTQTVNPAVTSMSLASSVDPSVTGQPVTITATVSVNAPGSGAPTGIVAFLDDGTTIAGCAVEAVSAAGIATCADVLLAAGSETIIAVYSGDADFASSTSAPLTQTINQGATATALTSSVNPSVAGQGVAYTVTVSAIAPAGGTPTGTVAFQDATSTIAGCAALPLIAGTASCTLASPGAGSHAITAVYSGDANFAGSTSAPLNQQVVLARSTTTVTAAASTWAAGDRGVFTATVSPVSPAHVSPSGTAAFMDAGTPIPGCAAEPVVSGSASCRVSFRATGSDPITAVYSGDAALTGSTSPAFMLSVYDDPPTPDAGAPARPFTSLAYAAIVGGVLLVLLVGGVRFRRRTIDGD